MLTYNDVQKRLLELGEQAMTDAESGPSEPTLEKPSSPELAATVASPTRERAGAQIDRYKLLRQIGEGGFGSVWMAEQREPVKRRVALKIIKLGMDTRQVIARFEAERQALAMMDHPHIAKVLDAGSTETGRPYFVMEYIRGIPILEYCDKEKLDTRQRLELIISVCQAIQHAHQKGIIHRDIKQSNVLITMHDGKPVPKVIDFGIAKATNTELTQKTLFTEHRQMIGTPAYMSPEQAEMSGLDIDTRSDIYSLGVLLYELLTGTTPFNNKELLSKGYAEMMRIIREVEPHKPSTRLSTLGDTATSTALHRHVADPKKLRMILRGDLDWIVMKCLEKDRTRRYETANGLAADIKRHLNDEPVVAGPPSGTYRLRKLIRRNRAVFAAGGVVSAALLLGILATTYGLIRAKKAERVASIERDTAQELRQIAEQQRDRADRQSRKLYASQVLRIGAAIDESNYRGMREHLESCPEDLRNWEWQHLSWRVADRSIQTLTLVEKGDGVDDVAFHGNGTRLLVAGGSGLRTWDLSAGRVVPTIPLTDQTIDAIDWSADGRYVLSAEKGSAQLRELATGRQTAAWPLPSLGGSPAIAISNDGAQVVVGKCCSDSPCPIFNVSDPEPIAELPNLGRAPVFSHDGRKVAYAHNPYCVAMLDIPEGKRILFPPQSHSVMAVAFSSDDRFLVSGGRDKTVSVYDVATNDTRLTLRGHQDTVKAVAVSPDGTQIASGGTDQTVRLWDAVTGEPLGVFLGHTDEVQHVSFMFGGNRLVSVDARGILKTWPVTCESAVLSINAHAARPVDKSHALAVTFRQDGRERATSGADGLVKLWDPDTGRLLKTLKGQGAWTRALAYRPPDGRVLASADDHGVIKLWDTRHGTMIRSIRAPVDDRGFAGIPSIAFSPDGSRLAAVSRNVGSVRVWDPYTGKELLSFKHSDARACAFFPDGEWIAHTGRDGIFVRDAASGEVKRTLWTHAGLGCLAISPDGRYVAVGGRDSLLRLLEVATGEETVAVDNSGGEVTSVAFSPDGQRIFCGLRDNTVKVWSVTGEELLALRGHKDMVQSVAMSPDGKTLASSASDGTVRLWETGPPACGFEVRQTVSAARALGLRLLREHEWIVDALDAVTSDSSIDPDVRDETRRMLRSQFPDMNVRSWRVARSPGHGAIEYESAVREAQAALHDDPDNALVINTLGAAQYRAGQYESAKATLTRSLPIHESATTWAFHDAAKDLAFLAMTNFRLGDEGTARKHLERLKSLTRDPRFQEEHLRDARSTEDCIVVRLSAEAEALILEGRELTGSGDADE